MLKLDEMVFDNPCRLDLLLRLTRLKGPQYLDLWPDEELTLLIQ